MTEPGPVGAPGGRRHSWATRAVTTVPLLAMTAGWTLVLGDRADAPPAAMIATAAAPATVDPLEPSLPEAVTAPVTDTPGSTRDAPTTDLSRTASAADIPDAALAAYQRAATVINATDRGCRLPWELLAGIGRVESNHGRFAGSQLDASGVASPAILGIALDGTQNTAVIADTDQGELDGDPTYDRAVGPMQFIPSTWTYVGVDADGDGVRNPQDIDDAALAAAVYLCVGDQDLSTIAGQRSAVHRYNHSQSYVDLVLRIARAYATGDYSTVPTASVPSLPSTAQTRPTQQVVPPAAPPAPPAPEPPKQPHAEQVTPDPQGTEEPPPPTFDPVLEHPSPDPDPGETPTSEGETPTSEDPTPDSDPSPGDDPTPDGQPGSDGDPTPDADPTPSGDPTPMPITPDSAAALCLEAGYLDDPEVADEPYDACTALLLSDPPEAVLPTVAELLARLEAEAVPLP